MRSSRFQNLLRYAEFKITDSRFQNLLRYAEFKISEPAPLCGVQDFRFKIPDLRT